MTSALCPSTGQLLVWSSLSFVVFFVHRNRMIITIILYIYHALINALSAHMIHINLNMIFYTHVEHSPTKTIYIKYYLKTNKKTQTHIDTQTQTHRHIDTHTHTHRQTHTLPQTT